METDTDINTVTDLSKFPPCARELASVKFDVILGSFSRREVQRVLRRVLDYLDALPPHSRTQDTSMSAGMEKKIREFCEMSVCDKGACMYRLDEATFLLKYHRVIPAGEGGRMI